VEVPPAKFFYRRHRPAPKWGPEGVLVGPGNRFEKPRCASGKPYQDL